MIKNKISLTQLESFLDKSAVILRGSMDSSEYKEFIFGMLFLKRMSDQFDKKREKLKKKHSHLSKEELNEILEDKNSYGDTFFVPHRARWNSGFNDNEGVFHSAIKDFKQNIGEELNKAIAAIEESNDILEGILKSNINFNKTTGKNQKIKDSVWKELIDHFNSGPILINENFEFPDLLGAAYEYLIKFFADSAGKKGGEFYTPNEVVRLLVQILKPKEGMEVYDPCVGSGGMLIQSAQYIEEQGGDSHRVALFGQEKAGTVWAICAMNMILHNNSDAAGNIENGDTITNPLHKQAGTYKKFDRVIANPPFSQNYNRSEVKFEQRFSYGWAPETGKKADLMFVQHMIASLKDKGIMATIMPHGVLFRGGREKLIREKLIEGIHNEGETVIEAIIGLPQGLFYGTGIPACILVVNKNKPDELKDKILFINADAEFAEGKNQNKLRPEDIEKIDYVFTNKKEYTKYSRLVSLKEIRDNEYNLNIRRYIDNTPESEPENVKAHLKGGIPKLEVEGFKEEYIKFSFEYPVLLSGSSEFLKFRDDISEKDLIKAKIEDDGSVKESFTKMRDVIEKWWKYAKDDFSKIELSKENGHKISEIRKELLHSMKKDLVKVGVLDNFQSAGVFVNWWNNIKYDLKTISSVGWSESLILDEMIISEFFSFENEEIEKVEGKLAEEENLLSESLEEVDYEGEEDKKPTKSELTKFLKTEIKELKSLGKSINEFKEQLDTIEKHDKEVKVLKKELNSKEKELGHKVLLKRLGSEGSKHHFKNLKELASNELKEAEASSEDKFKGKKRTTIINALKKDIIVIDKKLIDIDDFMNSIGGMIESEECKLLILRKHFDLINNELNRYLDNEKRTLIAIFENFWDKYKVSSKELEEQKVIAKKEIDGYLNKLGYYND